MESARTFATFTVTPYNRLAVDAARRVAELPGAAYNPLVIVGGAGAGKTHLLQAIMQFATQLRPDDVSLLATAAQLATGAVAPDPDASLLLVDDVHLLQDANAGRDLAERCRAALSTGAQVVLALRGTGDEVDPVGKLDQLLSLGLVVELGAGSPESLRATDVGAGDSAAADGERRPSTDADPGVSGRPDPSSPEAGDTRAALEPVGSFPPAPAPDPAPPGDEFGSFLADVSRVVAVAVESVPWRRKLAEAIAEWEGKGIRADRLEAALGGEAPPDVDTLLRAFNREAERLLEIRSAMGADAAAFPLDNPDQLAAAETIFTSWRDSTRDGSPAPPEIFRTVDPWFLDPDRLVLSAFDCEGRVPGDRR